MQNVEMWCWSLYRDRDFHTRFHFDHYELSGQWHGEFAQHRLLYTNSGLYPLSTILAGRVAGSSEMGSSLITKKYAYLRSMTVHIHL
jgi:hypothetical protein